MANRTIVVGGGVIGTATAYYLARLGCAVTLVEQSDLCSGSSQGNAGQITPGHLPLPQPGTLLRNLRWLAKSTSPLYIAPRLDVSLIRWLWNFPAGLQSGSSASGHAMPVRIGKTECTPLR